MSRRVLILGGGPAGASAAITLARAGHAVTLLERERTPTHKVCGEFLSHEALDELTHLGLDPAAAVSIHSVRLAAASTSTAQANLPFTAKSLTRRCLDALLLTHAEALGAHILRGCTVQRLKRESAGWLGHTASGETFTADELLLATGKHDLHGHPRGAGKHPNLVAFKMYFRLTPAQRAALSGHVELVLYPGGYGGLQPVEDDAANLCCLIERKHLQRLGGWPQLLEHMQHHNPHLRTRLTAAEPLLPKPLALSAIPYGFLRRTTEPHLWHLGDQAAVIPSFTGDGMSIALYSGRLAAEMLLAARTAHDFQQRLHHTLTRQVSLATHLSRAMTTPLGRCLAEPAIKLYPQALTHIASHTRLRSKSSTPYSLLTTP